MLVVLYAAIIAGAHILNKLVEQPEMTVKGNERQPKSRSMRLSESGHTGKSVHGNSNGRSVHSPVKQTDLDLFRFASASISSVSIKKKKKKGGRGYK